MSDRSEITWAPRVSLRAIRELYEREARGDCDDEYIGEVGYALYARCLSILEFTEACAGSVRCKRCSRLGMWTIIERKSMAADEMLRCPVCGWQVRWRVYLAESDKIDGQLHGSNATEVFRRFTFRYPQCATREEKILAIDRLVHEFHWMLDEHGKDPQGWKPAGVNLLRGSTTQVIEMLNELSYGEHTPAGLLEMREWWRSQKSIARRNKGM